MRRENKKCFTLIEMIVVMSIAVLILGISYANYRDKERKELVFLNARRLAGILKQAQSLALSGQEFSGSRPLGYGIYLSTNNAYIFFISNDNYLYNSGEEVINYSLSKHIFFNLNPFSPNHYVFDLPLATFYFNNVSCGLNNQEIPLFDEQINKQAKVKINCLSGQIEVE